MFGLDTLDTVFVIFAFLLQIVLIVHFALRRWAYDTAIRFGPLVYALGIPAAAISMAQFVNGEAWYMWLGGALYAVYGAFGYIVDYIAEVQWRKPIYLPVFLPYIGLYLGALCFYWWPLGTISSALWYAYTALFLISTTLNLMSHDRPEERGRPRLT